MNNWMTEERRQIVQKYVHDMIITTSMIRHTCRSIHLILSGFSRKHVIMISIQ